MLMNVIREPSVPERDRDDGKPILSNSSYGPPNNMCGRLRVGAYINSTHTNQAFAFEP